jgi:uncharacterized protein (DUF488 family)
MRTFYTIGHSNHPIEKFLDLLKTYEIDSLCDVRSKPYSRYHPQFRYEQLKTVLQKQDIHYVFLGQALGGKPDDLSCYEEGELQYARVVETERFQTGLLELKTQISTFRVALMCAEKEPLDCHRTILICRHLRDEQFTIKHILANGCLEDQAHTEKRLIDKFKLAPDLAFKEKLEQAYERQSQKLASHTPGNRKNIK